ncbi:PLC-like phosphodiesterase [Cylindrobasidium torrendii FP15055 ss-10]|uniref:Phosphoinositide phospholipase C n=1 Tax=Cylindrobasidium torrendii FP15055 ss-10 TaxID=1314674 RepID=A0A0D7BWA7_9AGAR|nr:PLC-like phosphodiesterase [Cylindrobasidium torrendii FP15055 ss-10]
MATPQTPPELPDMSVPDELQKGMAMLKVSKKKEKRVTVRIDADQGQIVYQSKHFGIIPIESIKEIRTGAQVKYYREDFKLPTALEARWITIIYIVEGAYKTKHFIVDTQSQYDTWIATLNRLQAIRQGLMTGLGNIEVRDAVWEKQYWKGADKSGDNKLDLVEAELLVKRLNVDLPPVVVKQYFEEADTQKLGYLDIEAFRRLVKLLKRRPDIELVYKNLGTLDLPGFTKFLVDTQKSQADASHIFAKFSPNEAVMSLQSFTSFLSSQENTPFTEQHHPVWQDMDHPMSHYYISSSHNTYLVGHQLVGVSTIEGYIRALLHSCRSVEMDIYDGDDGEPVVYHGKTLTSVVSVRNVCEAIVKYAFVTSPYAIIISAEIHCGVKQQDKIVDIMSTVFGETLVQEPLENRPPLTVLPSPNALKGKILLKAKNVMVAAQMAALQKQRLQAEAEAMTSSSSSSSESDEESPGKIGALKGKLKGKLASIRGKNKPAPEPHMSLRLASLLVYTVGVKCLGFKHPDLYSPEHIFSLSENRAKRQASVQMIRHTQSNMVRVYPKGTRVSSTNYEPQTYWSLGSQVVAINWQTFDLGYLITQAMFLRNGRSGWVLKPPALLPGGEELLKKRTKHRLVVDVISAQQLPRAKDKTGAEIVEKSTIDPIVSVTLHAPLWLTADGVLSETQAAPTASTKAIKNNGFNPVWNDKLVIPFDCVGDMFELMFVEFSVRDDGEDEGTVAKYCIPLVTMGRGYRHLPLHDEQLSQFLFSTLFVKMEVEDLPPSV